MTDILSPMIIDLKDYQTIEYEDHPSVAPLLCYDAAVVIADNRRSTDPGAIRRTSYDAVEARARQKAALSTLSNGKGRPFINEVNVYI